MLLPVAPHSEPVCASDPGFDWFDLTAEHVTLLRASYVSWNEAEWGSPTVDPKRPFGNGDLTRDIHRLLTGSDNWDGAGLPEDLTPLQWRDAEDGYRVLYRELDRALEVVLRSGSFTPGRYFARRYHSDWFIYEAPRG